MSTIDAAAPREDTAAQEFLRYASFHSRSKYVLANPNSDVGDPNNADKHGYEFVGFWHNGLLLYRRKDERPTTRLDFFTKMVSLIGVTGITCVLLMFPQESVNNFRIGIFLGLFAILAFIDMMLTGSRALK